MCSLLLKFASAANTLIHVSAHRYRYVCHGDATSIRRRTHVNFFENAKSLANKTAC